MSEVTIRLGDARALELPDSCVDAIVCDPPYELGFMGKRWDASGVAYDVGMWREAYRVLKPGGHLLAFGGTRTAHRMACAIEDAGFEIRDTITWLYGSGFPKSLDVSKAIDKAAGAAREVVGDNPNHRAVSGIAYEGIYAGGNTGGPTLTAPATDEAREWAGWGTALKPASEPITVARKPLRGTVVDNVLTHGTGALNIDGCRVGTESTRRTQRGTTSAWEGGAFSGDRVNGSGAGRWPANVVLSHAVAWNGGDACAGPDGCISGCPVAALDEQSGVSVSTDRPRNNTAEAHNRTVSMGGSAGDWTTGGHCDSGGASRFFPTFRYQAKAPTRERPSVDGVQHPTVKPLALMRWLVRLVTPPGGAVLDPFAGSGTTVEAAILEGFDVVAVESHEPYLALIRARVERCWAGAAPGEGIAT